MRINQIVWKTVELTFGVIIPGVFWIPMMLVGLSFSLPAFLIRTTFQSGLFVFFSLGGIYGFVCLAEAILTGCNQLVNLKIIHKLRIGAGLLIGVVLASYSCVKGFFLNDTEANPLPCILLLCSILVSLRYVFYLLARIRKV